MVKKVYDIDPVVEEAENDMSVEDANKLIELLKGMYGAGLAQEEVHIQSAQRNK